MVTVCVCVCVCVCAGVDSEGVGVVWSPVSPSSLSAREGERGRPDIPPMGGLRLAGMECTCTSRSH